MFYFVHKIWVLQDMRIFKIISNLFRSCIAHHPKRMWLLLLAWQVYWMKKRLNTQIKSNQNNFFIKKYIILQKRNFFEIF